MCAHLERVEPSIYLCHSTFNHTTNHSFELWFSQRFYFVVKLPLSLSNIVFYFASVLPLPRSRLEFSRTQLPQTIVKNSPKWKFARKISVLRQAVLLISNTRAAKPLRPKILQRKNQTLDAQTQWPWLGSAARSGSWRVSGGKLA